MLWKGVYSYEYMDSWERFDETLLLEKTLQTSISKMQKAFRRISEYKI